MTRKADPYAALVVLDTLQVGPVRLEKRRLRASYAVTRGRRTTRFEFAYRYEEDVFRPGDPADENLGALLAAQVALNYGLFAKRIVLHGPLDAHDRAFLAAMAENTAREILVKKFLHPNPFLVGAAAKLPVVPQRKYLRARLEFPDALRRPAASAPFARGGADEPVPAVLSSGGKDSLLSFGLLDELGRQPHAVYVNESGRHWYTALNAYRAHERERPDRVARVWTNCDRLFAFMARQLPFVRKDFQDVRADIYPVRLWTVAVFSFGALPVLRARGLSQLVIGDEYDTSRRARFRGIPHYDGVYDQSRWFDAALSKFYRRKGWTLEQFSLLRPLSELLILDVLASRYPELQRHQMSCHAASIVGRRVRPCGACEKCRRVVGMLVALDHDPRRCGYDTPRIEACLADLARRGVATEAPCAEHVAHMLAERGKIRAAVGDATAARAHPEVRALRIDPRVSPLTDIPVALRTPLLGLLLQHATGALARRGGRWHPIHPVPETPMPRKVPAKSGRRRAASAAAAQSAASGASGRARPPAPIPTDGPRPWMLGDLTWPAAGRRLKEVDVALLPVGSIEQHGPHLPLDVDAFDAAWQAEEVARRCSDPKPLVLPLIPYGVAYNHDDFSGTISVGPEALSRMVHEVGLSAARAGIKKLIIVNGHGGNRPALRFAAQQINRDAHIFTCVETGETSDADVARITETAGDVHAGEIETSTTLANRPHLVPMELARRSVPDFASRYLDFSSEHAVEWFARTSRISKSGVLGDPTLASAEKGREIWDVIVNHMVDFVEHLKGLSLDEIYQKRY